MRRTNHLPPLQGRPLNHLKDSLHSSFKVVKGEEESPHLLTPNGPLMPIHNGHLQGTSALARATFAALEEASKIADLYLGAK